MEIPGRCDLGGMSVSEMGMQGRFTSPSTIRRWYCLPSRQAHHRIRFQFRLDGLQVLPLFAGHAVHLLVQQFHQVADVGLGEDSVNLWTRRPVSGYQPLPTQPRTLCPGRVWAITAGDAATLPCRGVPGGSDSGGGG